MKQHNSCLSPKLAGMALALFGLCAVLGPGSIGEVQAGQQALSQSFVMADRVGTGDYAATFVKRGTNDRKCTRSINNDCEKPPSCKPGILVCRVDVDPMVKQ
ncbi:MAG: hypothetical protein CAF43_008795 [Nitrospira sp. CG24C]|jgi:hypothetical protein|nr:MAG: hypothetical protein CAF43_008795 [Nitrospira sp. CG24C]